VSHTCMIPSSSIRSSNGRKMVILASCKQCAGFPLRSCCSPHGVNGAHKVLHQAIASRGHSGSLHAMRMLSAEILLYPTWRKRCASLALRCIFMFRSNAFHAAGRNRPSSFCKRSLKTTRSTCSRTPTSAPFSPSDKPSCPRICNWQGELEAKGTK
jgi:hypothetical protein